MRGDVGLALPAGEAAAQNLGHRGEVVGLAFGERADLETAVVGLLRRSALEHDHRGDRLRPTDVRDVEALDPDRGHVQAERLLQPLERLHPSLTAALGAQPLLVEREPRIALGQLEDAALLAALGRTQLDRTLAAAGERIGERLTPSSSRWTTSSAGIEMCPP